jgi:hypothetical protein
LTRMVAPIRRRQDLGHPKDLIAALLATTFAGTTSQASVDRKRALWGSVQPRRGHRAAAINTVRREVFQFKVARTPPKHPPPIFSSAATFGAEMAVLQPPLIQQVPWPFWTRSKRLGAIIITVYERAPSILRRVPLLAPKRRRISPPSVLS